MWLACTPINRTVERHAATECLEGCLYHKRRRVRKVGRRSGNDSIECGKDTTKRVGDVEDGGGGEQPGGRGGSLAEIYPNSMEILPEIYVDCCELRNILPEIYTKSTRLRWLSHIFSGWILPQSTPVDSDFWKLPFVQSGEREFSQGNSVRIRMQRSIGLRSQQREFRLTVVPLPSRYYIKLYGNPYNVRLSTLIFRKTPNNLHIQDKRDLSKL
ncbi:hypothetical protein BJ138DRAFT_1184068 [Hygrophoropsis aurantiaca]|uniref:Uncharacterized protein n=1 Tax=Hygrophoropsis aurantiaca TaxID=72124 RepID=A0ACB7ZVS0_9AGAM|nr:hypothetical protein BJ138DRAFT_1184068 [Hygrophoropsis aurantiaca]